MRNIQFLILSICYVIALTGIKLKYLKILLNNQSSLYYGLECVCLPLTFDQQHEIPLDFYYVQTKNFYSTFSPRKLDLWTPQTDKILGYNGPYVNISVVNDSISLLSDKNRI